MDKLAYIGAIKNRGIGKIFTITADTLPVLDGWGWQDYWGCGEWIVWHKANVKKYGLDSANQKFIGAWDLQGFGAKPRILCANTPSFIEYFSNNKLAFNSLLVKFYKASNTVESGTTVVKDKAVSVTNTANNFVFFGTLFAFYLGYQLLKPDNISNTIRAVAR